MRPKENITQERITTPGGMVVDAATRRIIKPGRVWNSETAREAVFKRWENERAARTRKQEKMLQEKRESFQSLQDDFNGFQNLVLFTLKEMNDRMDSMEERL